MPSRTKNHLDVGLGEAGDLVLETVGQVEVDGKSSSVDNHLQVLVAHLMIVFVCRRVLLDHRLVRRGEHLDRVQQSQPVLLHVRLSDLTDHLVIFPELDPLVPTSVLARLDIRSLLPHFGQHLVPDVLGHAVVNHRPSRQGVFRVGPQDALVRKLLLQRLDSQLEDEDIVGGLERLVAGPALDELVDLSERLKLLGLEVSSGDDGGTNHVVVPEVLERLTNVTLLFVCHGQDAIRRLVLLGDEPPAILRLEPRGRTCPLVEPPLELAEVAANLPGGCEGHIGAEGSVLLVLVYRAPTHVTVHPRAVRCTLMMFTLALFTSFADFLVVLALLEPSRRERKPVHAWKLANTLDHIRIFFVLELSRREVSSGFSRDVLVPPLSEQLGIVPNAVLCWQPLLEHQAFLLLHRLPPLKFSLLPLPHVWWDPVHLPRPLAPQRLLVSFRHDDQKRGGTFVLLVLLSFLLPLREFLLHELAEKEVGVLVVDLSSPDTQVDVLDDLEEKVSHADEFLVVHLLERPSRRSSPWLVRPDFGELAIVLVVVGAKREAVRDLDLDRKPFELRFVVLGSLLVVSPKPAFHIRKVT
mmetsp:Transcript_18558/g.42368  ORF Transcript_18558/g.42368 Transcript_18558/m.42368 type:complete len:581 (-) Transcript_18558:405-2147(-)